tara:strand:- start:43 stop:228 length:186 start_codon:yes stop_codon:yes gene_type:complete
MNFFACYKLWIEAENKKQLKECLRTIVGFTNKDPNNSLLNACWERLENVVHSPDFKQLLKK